jgi:hypothetical protein
VNTAFTASNEYAVNIRGPSPAASRISISGHPRWTGAVARKSRSIGYGDASLAASTTTKPGGTSLNVSTSSESVSPTSVSATVPTCAFNALFDRLPGLRLDPDAPAPYIAGMYSRSQPRLDLVWD